MHSSMKANIVFSKFKVRLKQKEPQAQAKN